MKGLILVFLLAFSSFTLIVPAQTQQAHAATSQSSSIPLNFTWQAPVPKGPHIVPPVFAIRALPNGSIFIGNNAMNQSFNFGSSAAVNPTSFTYNSTGISYSYTLSHNCQVTASYSAPTGSSPNQIKQSFSSKSCAHIGTYPFAFFSKKGILPIGLNANGGTSGPYCQFQYGQTFYSWCGDKMVNATMGYVPAGNSYTLEIITTQPTWYIDPSILQKADSGDFTGLTGTCTFGSNVGSGDLIAIYSDAISSGQAVPQYSSASGSRGETWTNVQAEVTDTGTQRYDSSIVYGTTTSAGSEAVSVTMTQTTNQHSHFWCYDVSGVGTTTIAGNVGSSTSASLAVASFTASSSKGFTLAGYIGNAAQGGGSSAGTGFTLDTAVAGGELVESSITVTGSQTCPATSASSETYNGSCENFAPSTITITEKCTTSPAGATQDAGLAFSGAAYVSGGGTTCDGLTHSITAKPSTASLVVTVGAAGANQLYRFNQAGTLASTITITTGASNSNWFFTEYLTDTQAVSYSITDILDICSAPTFTFTSGGNSTTYTATTTGVNKQIDDGTTWTTTNPLTGSTSTERCEANSGATGTGSAGAAIAPAYYRQFSCTCSYSGAVAAGGAPSLAGNAYGVNSILSMPSVAPATIWKDKGASYTITKPLADFPSSTERYDTNLANGTVSSAFTVAPVFYHQFSNTYTASPQNIGNWDYTYSLAASGTIFGATGTVCTINAKQGDASDSCSGFADTGLVVSLPASFAGGAGTGTWTCYATCSWTDTTGGNTHAAQYSFASASTPNGGGGGSSGGGGGSGRPQIVNAVNQVAQNLPVLTPAFVGNPALDVLGEIVTVGVVAFILLAAAFSRRGRPIGARTRSPNPAFKRTRSPRIISSSKPPGVFNWGTKKTDFELP